MGASKWMKAKLALGLKLNSCLYVSRTVEDSPAVEPLTAASRFSDAALSSHRDSDYTVKMPSTPTPSSSGLLLPNYSSKSSKMICAICLNTMKPGDGHAIFTGECSHSFHFHCIASNVKHGKKICPVCRAKWKEIPFQLPIAAKSHGSAGRNNASDISRQVAARFQVREPSIFNDDEEVTSHESSAIVAPNNSSSNTTRDGHFNGEVDVKTYPEVSAVPRTKPHSNFSILVHLKAPVTTGLQHSDAEQEGFQWTSHAPRAPVDLVAVLDVSGSMAGTKLALLKRAIGFIIQNLGPSDRLSVISFSSTARRLFPLRRMNETGRNEALQAVNSLSSNGGTNIAEGLRKGAKTMTDRKYKNPVSSILLLSDGQDTYTNNNPRRVNNCSVYQSLLPVDMHCNSTSSLHIPVHTFGFGGDHDAESMHLISQTSGGTFSFIEAESVIQDAFAQCIGGLLSVVAQELKVEIECIDPMLHLNSIKSGSYKTILASDKRAGSIEIGDLYAEEERNFLVTTDIPVNESSNEMSLIKVKCVYKHPVSKKLVTLDSSNDLIIQRPSTITSHPVSLEVDKHRNRLRCAEAMAEAKTYAEQGDLTSAVSLLENCRKQFSETVSAQAGDKLCVALDAELQQMQERMANQHVYEMSGRAYMLSGLSSHSWQRATARGDSTDSSSHVRAYQTRSMVDMVTLSQTMVFGSPSPRPPPRPSWSPQSR